jgi:hypothetical protein
LPDSVIDVVDETTGTMPAESDSGYAGPGPQRVVKVEADRQTGFAPGERVRHATYGVGRVVSFQTQGGRRLVVVPFNTVGQKILDPKYAKLIRISAL